MWRFIGYDDDESYQFFVDTNAGDLVGVQDLVEQDILSGTVTGLALPCCPIGDAGNPCCASDNPSNPNTPGPEATGMNGVEVQVVGGPQVFADADGFYQFDLPPDEEVTVESRLIGEWVTVVNASGDELVVSQTATPPDDQVNLEFNSIPSEFDTAQVNAFVAIQYTHDWFRALAEDFTDIDQQTLCQVNVGTCGASFQPPLTFKIGGSDPGVCANIAVAPVLTHEYGHFIKGQLLDVLGNFSEGISDTFAALVWKTNEIGFDLFLDNTAFRDVDVPNVRIDDCSSLPEWCDNCDDSHCVGLAIAGAFWDTRVAFDDDAGTNVDEVDQLFADFMFVTDGGWDNSLLLEALIADDDNANLIDGTEHYLLILAGFEPNGFTDPLAAGVVVKWEGPSGDPVLTQDYTVEYDVEPPNVTLKTTEKDSVAVTKWFIGRVTGDPPQKADIGAITADWDPPGNNNILIEVGTLVDTPCRNLEIVDIDRQSAANWSSVEVDFTGALNVRARCYAADNGDGGRISGTVAGDANLIVAEAIGTGGTGVATLDVQGLLMTVALEELPFGSELLGASLVQEVTITGELGGSISVDSIVFSDGPSAAEKGAIRIRGGAVSTGSITVGTLKGGKIVVDGGYAGTLSIQNMTDGDSDALASVQTGELTGTIEILDATTAIAGMIEVGTDVAGANVGASGLIDVKSWLGADAQVVVHGDVQTTGKIRIEQGVIGTNSLVTIEGNLDGALGIGNKVAVPPVVGNVSGDVLIGGNLVGVLGHNGKVLSGGTITVVGDVTSTGRYTQTGAGISPGVPPFWEGSLTVEGDLDGTVAFSTELSGATITVEGNHTGTMTVHEMIDSSILLNTVIGNTSGAVRIGHNSTEWNPDGFNVVHLDLVNIAGDFTTTGTVRFRGCFPTIPGSYTMESLCIIGAEDGQVIRSFCPGATVNVDRTCPGP